MAESSLIQLKPLRGHYIVWVVLGALFLLCGYLIGIYSVPSPTLDILALFAYNLGVPFLVTVLGFYLGWRAKKFSVVYSEPGWSFKPVQIKVDELVQKKKAHNKEYARLVSRPHNVFYYGPIVLLVVMFTLPIFAHYIEPELLSYYPSVYVLLLMLLLTGTIFGGFRSTSNVASQDFTFPVIRESVKIARIQSKVPGTSHIRIVLEEATNGPYVVYRQPRVVVRIVGVEHDAYLETWSDDLSAVSKMLVRILEAEGHPEVIWWWFSEDRYFRKYTG
jgi:hypothetical protein